MAHYKKGYYIDCVDDCNRYQMAQIMDLMNDTIKVHFDGWGTRYDKVYFSKGLQHPQPKHRAIQNIY